MKQKVFELVKLIKGELSLMIVLPKEVIKICDLEKSDLMICIVDEKRIILEKKKIDNTEFLYPVFGFGD